MMKPDIRRKAKMIRAIFPLRLFLFLISTLSGCMVCFFISLSGYHFFGELYMERDGKGKEREDNYF
jgi:hypothetical protein